MAQRTRAQFDEMRRRMVAAKDRPADVQNFFFSLEAQPDEEADYMWEMADKRLTAFENGEWHKLRGHQRPPMSRAAIRRHNWRLNKGRY